MDTVPIFLLNKVALPYVKHYATPYTKKMKEISSLIGREIPEAPYSVLLPRMEHYSTIISRNLKYAARNDPIRRGSEWSIMLEFSSDIQHLCDSKSKKHLEVSTEESTGGKGPVLLAVGRVTHWLYGERGETCGQGRRQMRQGTKRQKRRGKRGARVM